MDFAATLDLDLVVDAEHQDLLVRLEEDLPTTPEDVAALHRIREQQRAAFRLEDVNLLNPPAGLPVPRRLTTHEGWEPFELRRAVLDRVRSSPP